MAEPPLLPLSDAIGLSRLICILGIVYVHAWTGIGGDAMAAQAGSPQDVLRWTIVELFGRSAVPLLSIIAGWLVAGSLAKRGYRGFVAGKVRSVLLPMLLWNMLAIVLVTGAGGLGLANMPLLGDPGWIADNLFNLIRAGDINVQTAFLRDLFVCMLGAPLLVRMPVAGLIAIIALTALWATGGWQIPLLLRPAILLFFVVGLIIRRHGLAARLGTLPFRVAALPFVAVAPLKIGLSILGQGVAGYHVALVNAVDLLLRAGAALLAWCSAMALARHPSGRRLLELERYAFFLFCSHLLFMWLLAPAIGTLSGVMGSPGWPVFFLLQPLLALGFAVLLARGVAALSPKAAALLSGGRLGRDHTASPAALPLAQAHWKL